MEINLVYLMAGVKQLSSVDDDVSTFFPLPSIFSYHFK